MSRGRGKMPVDEALLGREGAKKAGSRYDGAVGCSGGQSETLGRWRERGSGKLHEEVL